MDALRSKIERLENQVKVLRSDRDRFRQLAADAEAETVKRRTAYLKLENDYEMERRKRVKLEMELLDVNAQWIGNTNETPDLAMADARKPGLDDITVEEISELEELHSPTFVAPPPVEIHLASSSNKQEVPQTPKSSKKDMVEKKVVIKRSPLSKRKLDFDEDPNVVDQKKKVKITGEGKKMDSAVRQNSLSSNKKDNALLTPVPKAEHDPNDAPSGGSQTLDPSDSPYRSVSVSSASFEGVTPRPRRPIKQTSRLPITMAQRQSAVAVGTGSSPPAVASSSSSPETPPAKTLLVKSQRQKVPARPLVPPITGLASGYEPSSITKTKEHPTITWKPRPLLTADSDSKKVQVKSDVKAEGGFTLSPTQVSKHLGNSAAFSTRFQINPVALPVRVSRRALTKAYGLPMMGFLWASKPKDDHSGNDNDKRHRFMLPKLSDNPEMPRSPGEAGLLLSCREEMCKTDGGPWTLFIQLQGGKKEKARMDYAGEYTCKTVGKMTKEEFAAQKSSVKQAWGVKIATRKKYRAYRELRARITLRKKLNLDIGVEPTKAQIAAEALEITSTGYTSCLTAEDVVLAFERGDERISIVKIECVAYNHELAKEYIQAQKDYEQRELADSLLPPEERKRKGKGKGKVKPQNKNKKARLGAQAPDGDDEQEEEVDELVESEGEDDANSIRPVRGSRGKDKEKEMEMESQEEDLSDLTELDSDTDWDSE